MDLTTLFHNLREEVTCSVCSDLFTDPKHLFCLHSFCLKCLKRWYETCGGGEAVKCPKCQTLSRVPSSGDLKDLPTSFHLNGLIDVLAIKECKSTQVTCGNCDKKSSEASYCFQCCIFYCEQCLVGHNMMRDKKEHRVLAVKEFQDKDYEDVLKRPVFCSKERHQKEELKYYCKECETALCQTCVTLNHGGHDLRLIEEEAKNKALEIKSIRQTQREGLDAKVNVITQLDEDCAKVIKQSEIARRDVQRFADGLIKTIQAKMKNIITTIDNQTKKSLESLKAKRSEIQRQINDTESSLEEADKLLKRSTTAEVVQLKKSLQTIFQGFNETEPIVYDPSKLQTLVFVLVKPVLSFGKQGSGDGMFDYPLGVAVSDGDEIVVADQGNHRVQVFDSNGTFLRSFGHEGENAGEFKSPIGICINKDRQIFVAERNRRIQIFSWEGRLLGSFGGKEGLYSHFLNRRGLSLDSNGNVIVADTGNKLIKIFTPDGRFVMKIGGQGSLSEPVHCVQCGEYFIVSDSNEHCIKVFNREGHFQYKFGKKGKGDGNLDCPRFLSVTHSKHLLVCDRNNHRIQVFELGGKFVGKFGTNGSNLGEFKDPFSVAVLSNDQIVVCEYWNHRIQIFQ